MAKLKNITRLQIRRYSKVLFFTYTPIMSVKSFNLIADTEISVSQEHWEGCLDETNTGRREKPKGSGISKEDKRANLFTM